MISSYLLVYAAIISVLLFLTYHCYKVMSVCSKIPGPKSRLILGNTPEIYCSPVEISQKLRKWATEFYPVYQISCCFGYAVNLLAPEDFEIVMSGKEHSSKSYFYDFLKKWLGTGLLTSQGSKWNVRRKILTQAFHFNILQEFIEVFNEESETLAVILHKSVKENADGIDIVPFVTEFTLNSINRTAMGQKVEMVNKEVKSNYKEALYELGNMLYFRLVSPWMHLKFLWFMSLTSWKEAKLVKVLHNFTYSVIAQGKKELQNKNISTVSNDSVYKKGRLAMLDLLLKFQRDGVNIDDEGIREEVDTFMFEGHDTTSMGLSFLLLLLANNKEAQEKIFEEIQEILGDCKERPTISQYQSLLYTERCVKEGLRLYPPVHFISRVTSEDITTHAGYYIPKGATLCLHIYDLHHNPKIYPDPEKFDPDRFLPDQIANRHPFAYLPFSAGPRNCIGQKFAMLEIKAALCQIIRNFILEPVDTPKSVELLLDLVLRPKNGIKIKFIPRQ